MNNVMPTPFNRLIWLVICLLLCTGVPGWAAEQKVTLATTQWPPYVSNDLKSNGYVAEIVTEAFKRAGYGVVFKYYPWPDALASTRSGKVTGLFPLYRDSGREADFLFSDPLAKSPLGLFKRSALPGKTPLSASMAKEEEITYPVDPRVDREAALKGLSDYAFGVVRGYANPPVIGTESFEVVRAVNDRENMENLMEGRIDLAVMDRRVGRYLIRQHHLGKKDQVTFMEPPLAVRPLFLAISKNTPDPEKMISAFNRALSSMAEDGVLKRIRESHGIER